jgi:uncharacterized membrane protein
MNATRKYLPEWVNEGLISREQAENIEKWLNQRQAKGPSMFTLIASLGALLVVSGLALVLSNNWYEFPHGLRLFLALCPAILASSFALLIMNRFVEIRAWREVAGIILFYAIGASVALIANVYHTETRGGFLILNWLICAAPAMFILNSRFAFILYFLYATGYALATGYAKHPVASPWQYSWMLSISFLFLLYDQKSVRANWFYIALSWIFPLALLFLLGIFSSHSDFGALNFLTYIGAMAILLIWAANTDLFTGNAFLNGIKIVPRIALLGILAAFSMADLWNKVVYENLVNKPGFQHDFLFWLSSTVVVFCTIAGLRSKYQKKQHVPPEVWAACLFPVVFYAIGFTWHKAAMWFVTPLLVFVGAVYVNRGIKSNRLPLLNYGLLWVAVALLCRIMDASQSNLVRGLIFIATGIVLLVFNLIFIRSRRKDVQHG